MNCIVKKFKTLLLALPLLTAASAAPASSDESVSCGQHDEMVRHLAGKYGEEPVAMGLSVNGYLVEILASGGGDSFTIVYTTPDGLTCMMAAGSNWETIRARRDFGA
jgi:hypothetical protein